MIKKTVAVVIPIHKTTLNEHEESSFKQTLSVLHSHDIFLITHPQLTLGYYLAIASELNKKIQVVYFDKHYFDSVESYNRLMLTTEFYRRFDMYEYMLICQTDVYVFRDELLAWCNKGYNYIGAPWISYKKKKNRYKFYGMGNGGFSLRKISYCLQVLNFPPHLPFLTPKGVFYFSLKLKDVLLMPLRVFGVRNTLHHFIENGFKDHVFEDIIFSKYAQHSWLKASMPSLDEAIRFSFEECPAYLFQRNGNQLPFGCHAYLKYEFERFWKNYITI